MRSLDGLLTFLWLGLYIAAYFSAVPIGVKAASINPPHRVEPTTHPNTIKNKIDPLDKSVPTKDKKELVDIFIEMQRRSEEEVGIMHTKQEEKEVGYFFEEDIVLTIPQAEEILREDIPQHKSHRRVKRKLAEPLAKRWMLPIPYVFDGTHTEKEKHVIRQALSYWEELTCIKFKENPSAERKLLFKRGPGCWSYVGFTHQVNQTISIGDGCQSNGTIAHEVGHSIGFWHEQSRPDRNDYIRIHEHNVANGKLYNFQKRSWAEIITMDIPYDLGSDMHYGAKFYSKDANNTYTTVETKDPLMTRVIGQRQELSFYDIKLANKAYCSNECAFAARLLEPCQRDGYQDPKDCARCRCPDGFGGRYCHTVARSKNAYCGGVLYAQFNGTLYSPGYPTPGYHHMVQCSWLIKAPMHHQVYLQFIDDFGIAGHLDVCKDYVEVRYNSSLSLTGARFCCRDPPRHPIRSNANEILVLFRSYNDSRLCDDPVFPWKCHNVFTGFKAKYYVKPCGGCGGVHRDGQPACVSQISYTCLQEWEEQIRPFQPDCGWWDRDCPQFSTKTMRRYTRCHKDILYCCTPFVLQDSTCVVNTRANDQPPPAVAPPPGEPPRPVTRPQELWSAWSPWGNCSRKCGGGVVVRTRRCIIPGHCGHNNIQVDKQSCAHGPCSKTCFVTRRFICQLWNYCTKKVLEPCRYCYDGYQLVNNQCLPASGG